MKWKRVHEDYIESGKFRILRHRGTCEFRYSLWKKEGRWIAIHYGRTADECKEFAERE